MICVSWFICVANSRTWFANEQVKTYLSLIAAEILLIRLMRSSSDSTSCPAVKAVCKSVKIFGTFSNYLLLHRPDISLFLRG